MHYSYLVSAPDPRAAYLKELYAWILQRYELFKQGKITEEAYAKDMEYYKNEVESGAQNDSSLAQSAPAEQDLQAIEAEKGISPTSKSVAELRHVLLKELGDFKKRYNIEES